jgi:phosphatidylglycerophosphatase A
MKGEPHIDSLQPPKRHSIRVLDVAAVALSSCFYTSFAPAKFVHTFQIRVGRKSLTEEKWTGAGFVGSLWGVGTYLALPERFATSFWPLAVGLVAAIFLSDRAEKSLKSHDDPRIVIDEWIGAWFALWLLPQTLSTNVILAFILFRVFDTFKGPWGHALQKLPGGFGVVMDDVMAGLLANIIVHVFSHF